MAGILQSPLFNVGLGLLQSGGWSPTPVSLGQSLGMGLQKGAALQQQAEMAAAQNQEIRDKQKAREAQREAFNQFNQTLKGPNPIGTEGLGVLQPQYLPGTPAATPAEQMRRLKEGALGLMGTPETFGQGVGLLKQMTPSPTKQPTGVQEAVAMGMIPGTSEFNDYVTRRAMRPATQINMGEQGNVLRQKAMIARDMKTFNEQEDLANMADDQILKAKEMTGLLLGGLKTGKTAGVSKKAGQVLSALGLSPEALGFASPEAAERFEQLANEFTFLKLAFMKGSMSERELDFAQNTVANLGLSPEANARFLKVITGIAKRNQIKAEMMRDWMDTHPEKGLGGFRRVWRAYVEDPANSIF